MTPLPTPQKQIHGPIPVRSAPHHTMVTHSSQDPVKAPISFLSSQQGWAVFTLVWWLWTYSPLATPLNFVYNRTPLKVGCHE